MTAEYVNPLTFNNRKPGDVDKGGSVRAAGENEPGMEKVRQDLKDLQETLNNLDAYGRKEWRAEDVLGSQKLYEKVSQKVPAEFNLDKLRVYLEILDSQKKLKMKKAS